MEAVTYSFARQNMSSIMNDVCENNEAKIITRNNKESVVMMSLEDYNSCMESCYLLSNPSNAQHLQRSIEQAEKGEFISVAIEDL